MSLLQNLGTIDYERLFPGTDAFLLQRYRDLFTSIIDLTTIIEGAGVPTMIAEKHAWYFDTAASKYYRNTDGGTTWVALN